MGFAVVYNPRLLDPIVVLKLRNVTWLSAFVASNRTSMFFRSPRRITRPSDAFNPNCTGPVIVSRPALPHWPAAGTANAAKLNGSPAGASVTERPVAFARTLPVMPVPVVVDRIPPTVGVSGRPLPTVIVFMKVQSLISLPFQPLTRPAPAPRPAPLPYCQVKLATCVRFVAETARSAAVSR